MLETRAMQDLELHWKRRADSLCETELSRTGLVVDLQRALDAAELGRSSVVRRWIELVERRLLKVWGEYEATPLLPEEMTLETTLGHRTLGYGIDGWLEVLERLREETATGCISRARLLQDAIEAQRALQTVDLMSSETEDVVDHFLAAWSN